MSRHPTSTSDGAVGTVVVCWTGYRAGPWALRSLRGGGYRAVGAHDAEVGLGGRSAHCRRPLRYPAPGGDPAGFAAAIADICRRERAIAVLPVSEDVTRALAQFGAGVPGVVVVGPDSAQYEALCDKAALASVCARIGVDHPAQIVVDVAGTPDGPWPGLPAIVKPALSSEHLGDVPAAERVDDAAARARVLARFVRAGMPAVVQDFVEGQAWVVHAVRGGAGVSLVAARVASTWPPRVGTSSVSRVVPAPPALARCCVEVLAAVDYIGPACMNLIERDGRFFLHDVNLRLPASVGASISAGLDMPLLGVQAALGREVASPAPALDDVLYVRTDGEIARAWRALRNGERRHARSLAAGMIRARRSGSAVLDPDPLDPFWLGSVASSHAVAAARRALAAVRRTSP